MAPEDVDPLPYCSGGPSVVITSISVCLANSLLERISRQLAGAANVPKSWHESPETREETRIRGPIIPSPRVPRSVSQGAGPEALTEN